MNNPDPISSKILLQMLNVHHIRYKLYQHKPLHTVEDAKSIRSDLQGNEGQIKNLFVKNKKGKMWLLTLHEDKKIDLKKTAIALGAGRFSFCSAEHLMQYLGVIPGAVSPLGLVNDHQKEVTFYIDKTLLDSTFIDVHPLDNRMTVRLSTQDMLEFLKSSGHEYHVFE